MKSKLDRSEYVKGIKTQAGYDMAMKNPHMKDKNSDGKVDTEEEAYSMSYGGFVTPDMEDLPLGATEENMADDITANLSADEYVLPAHVVKWHGVEKILSWQEEAEMGFAMMQEEGLIGGSPETSEEEDESVEEEMTDEVEEEEETSTSKMPGSVKRSKIAFIVS